MRIFLRLARYAMRYRARLVLIFLFSLLGILVELARPWPMKLVVDYVLAHRPLPGPLQHLLGVLPGGDGPGGLLVWCVLIACVIVLGAGGIYLVILNMTVRLAQRLVLDLSRDLFDKLQRLSLAYHGQHSVGDLLERMSNDVFVVHSIVSPVGLPGTIAALTLVGMFVVMANIDLGLSLIALGVVPLLGVALALYLRPINSTAARQWERQGSLMAFVEQSLGGIKVIQGFAQEAFVKRKLEDQADQLGQAYTDAIQVSGSYKEVTGFITGTAAAVMLGLGGVHVLQGSLSLGDLLIFIGYLAALYGPVNTVTTAVGTAAALVPRGKRVFEVLDSRDEVQDRTGAVCLEKPKGKIVFENVVFGYHDRHEGGEPVIRGISFCAEPGQVIALVGATGAGKSTLVSLISRFYEPWEGRVLIDDRDLRDVTLKSLRENVSLVLQEPFLFPMSIAENIAFGYSGAAREQIVEAAKAAQADDFIRRLPRRYDTPILQKGVSLSGGERQRIAIARAILKDSPILILDEPTSAVDARTESHILNAISVLVRNRTTFVISHRLTTIQRADQILVLEGGRIVEQGTHQELLLHGSVYGDLYRHQYIAYV